MISSVNWLFFYLSFVEGIIDLLLSQVTKCQKSLKVNGLSLIYRFEHI